MPPPAYIGEEGYMQSGCDVCGSVCDSTSGSACNGHFSSFDASVEPITNTPLPKRNPNPGNPPLPRWPTFEFWDPLVSPEWPKLDFVCIDWLGALTENMQK